MPVAGLAKGVVKLLQELSLVLGELDRCLDADVAVQVARIARAHALDPLAAKAEGLAVLRSFGKVDFGLAAERRHLDRSTERRARHCHRNGAMQVVAVTLEDVVSLDANLDVEVAVRPSVRARLAVAAGADAHAFVDARRNLHFERLVLLQTPLAVAGDARLGDDLARAVAGRAGLLDAEEALPHLHRAGAMACGAVDRAGPWLGSVALAGVAGLP